ncbi:MAG: hypothetical protein LBL93_02430 [Ruminococcus sp.]|jgi:hypothetical protein|nr:hypothetical protein [Ruminococcus sp.]
MDNINQGEEFECLLNKFGDGLANEVWIERTIPFSPLNRKQKNAVVAYAYDCLVNNGGILDFVDSNEGEFTHGQVMRALNSVGGFKFVFNYIMGLIALKVCDLNENWDFTFQIDNMFYGFKPSLADLFQKYLEKNEDKIFGTISKNNL